MESPYGSAKEEEATEDEMITEEEAEVPEEADELKLEVEPEKQPVTEPEEEQRPVQEPVRQPAIPVVPDTIEVPAFDKPEIQPVDTFVRIRFLLFSRRLRIKA